MLNKKLKENELYRIAREFRMAIIKAKRSGKFSYRDRMNNFPGGCCDDACDLLGYFLLCEYGIDTYQRNGVYRDEDPENTTNHAWLMVDDELVVDIVVTPFKDCGGFNDVIYVGQEIAFYRNLENRCEYGNFDITKDDRLWNDYQVILKCFDDYVD